MASSTRDIQTHVEDGAIKAMNAAKHLLESSLMVVESLPAAGSTFTRRRLQAAELLSCALSCLRLAEAKGTTVHWIYPDCSDKAVNAAQIRLALNLAQTYRKTEFQRLARRIDAVGELVRQLSPEQPRSIVLAQMLRALRTDLSRVEVN